MNPYSSQWAAPGQAPPRPGAGPYQTASQPGPAQQQPQPEHELTHRISNISDVTDFESYHPTTVHHHQPVAGSLPGPPLYQQQPIRGRESLVSLQSTYDSPYNSAAAASPYTPPSRAATAVSNASSTSGFGLQFVDGSRSTSGGNGASFSDRARGAGAGWTLANASYGSSNIAMSPVSSTSGGYQPVARSASGGGSDSGLVSASGLGRMFSRRNNLRSATSHSTILEEPGESRESIDMTSLVNSAAPMGLTSSSRTYVAVAKQDDAEYDNDASGGGADGIPFDVTGYLGPTTSQDEAFVKKLQEQEASGKLTLGLGAGFAPGARIRESDLLASPAVTSASLFSPTHGTSLRRSISKRWATSAVAPVASATGVSGVASHAAVPAVSVHHQLTRQDTVKALAQSEANRRGEIVEIIMEEDDDDTHGDSLERHHGLASEVDLSVVSGPAVATTPGGMDGGMPRQSTFPTSARSKAVQIFYPQPNWKPFSMRWPYLLTLILLSAGLAVTNEMIYQVSRRRPLVAFHAPEEIPPSVYFAVKFAPTLLTVGFGVLWQLTDFEVKRLESFYQMSKEGGAVADDSINVDYVTYFTFFRPFRALYCKHYAVAVSSVASILAVSLVPTLGAATIVLRPDRAERMADPEGEKRVTIDAVWSRILTAAFCVIAVLGCVLFWLLQRRRSGLQADVKGIAGLASMAVVAHILTDFKDMDVATHKDIHHKLRDHRYVLRNSSLAPDDENPLASSQERERYRDNHLPINPHPLFLRAAGCVPLIVGIVVFAAFLPVMLFTPANVVADKAAWVLTAMAVCIKLGWGGLETSVRLMEPYYLLWKRHAPAKTLTLDYTAIPFVLVAIQALFNGHLLVFFVGFGTLLTELLTVLVTSLATVEGHSFLGSSSASSSNTTTGSQRPSSQAGSRLGSADSSSSSLDSGQETAASFWVTLGLALFVLVYMALVATVVFVRRRRPFLPRQPTTIASVLAFIHQSKMLYSFVGTSKLSNAAMRRKLDEMDNQYGLGWFEGRDGQTHCGVDQEELLSSYKPGYDYTRSNQPWNDRHVDWL